MRPGWLSATQASQPGLSPGLMILLRMSMDLMTILQILRERPWAFCKAGSNTGGQSLRQLGHAAIVARQQSKTSPRSSRTAPALQRASVQPALAVALTGAGTQVWGLSIWRLMSRHWAARKGKNGSRSQVPQHLPLLGCAVWRAAHPPLLLLRLPVICG